MKQPHTESAVKHTDDEQNTGNHPKPGVKQQGGPDRFGEPVPERRMWSRKSRMMRRTRSAAPAPAWSPQDSGSIARTRSA